MSKIQNLMRTEKITDVVAYNKHFTRVFLRALSMMGIKYRQQKKIKGTMISTRLVLPFGTIKPFDEAVNEILASLN